ncbi:hypothetical protein F884_01236 [Acinetobacter sp. CIP 102143]|nr:hypothetical protein F884_01236 [Acinetobacter sp. CIP 102143]
MSDQDLAYHLQIKFGLSYNEPNSYQILAIKSDINQIVRSGRTPTQADWIRIIGFHCRTIGTHSRFGVDNTDLNFLLLLAIQTSK